MSGLVKVLLGAGVVAVAGAVAIAVAEKSEENAAEKAVEFAVDDKVKQELKDKEEERKEKSIFCRIKKYVQKKVVKFLAFVALHMEQIEAAGAIIGLGSTVLGIVGAVRDFKRGNDLNAKVNEIDNKLEHYFQVYDYNRGVDNRNAQLTLDYTRSCTNRVLYNQNVLGYELASVADKVGVDMDKVADEIEETFGAPEEKIA